MIKHESIASKWIGDASGRRIGTLDEPIVEKIPAEFPKHKHGLRSLIEAVVSSDLRPIFSNHIQ